jgi:hypothetical protein
MGTESTQFEDDKLWMQDITKDNRRTISVENKEKGDMKIQSLTISTKEEYVESHYEPAKYSFDHPEQNKGTTAKTRMTRVTVSLSETAPNGESRSDARISFLKPASQNPDAPIGIERDLENLDGLMEVYKEVAKSKPTVEGYKIQSFLDKYVFNTDNGRYALNQYLSENPRTEKPAKYTNNVKLIHKKGELVGAEVIAKEYSGDRLKDSPDGREFRVRFNVKKDSNGNDVLGVDIGIAKHVGPFKRYLSLCSKEAAMQHSKLKSFFDDPKAIQKLITAKAISSTNINRFNMPDILENARQAAFDELNNREVALMRSMRNKRANG